MSVSYNALPFFGIALADHELEVRKKNPLWGKHKFDPNTGEKVHQYNTTKLDLEHLLERTGLEIAEAYEHKLTFVGKKLGDEIDLNSDSFTTFMALSPEREAAFREAIKKFVDREGLAEHQPQYFIINQVSV